MRAKKMFLAFLLCVGLFGADETGKSVKAEKVDVKRTADTKLYVSTEPKGAKVLVKNGNASDGMAREAPKTSPSLFDIPAGVQKITITIELDGYASKKQTLEVQGGRVTRLSFDLKELPGGKATRAEKTDFVDDLDYADPREVLKTLLAAIARCDVGKVAQLGLAVHHDDVREFGGQFDLSGVAIDRMLCATEAVCAVTHPFTDKKGQGSHKLGIGLELKQGRWLVRDIDFLQDGRKTDKFVAEFHKAFPNAFEGSGGWGNDNGEEAAKMYAIDLGRGDLDALKDDFWDLSDPIDRMAADVMIEVVAQGPLPAEKRFQYLAGAPFGKNQFMAGFRVAEPVSGPLGMTPLFQVFTWKDQKWLTQPMPNLRFMTDTRTLSPEEIGRRAMIRSLINVRYGMMEWENMIACMRVQADVFRQLEKENGQEKYFGQAVKAIESSILEYQAWRHRPWPEVAQTMIKKHMGQNEGGLSLDVLLKDFYLLFFLEANDEPAGHRLTLPDRNESLFVEKLPCLTGDMVKTAACVMTPPNSKAQSVSVEVVLTVEGEKIFGGITEANIGKRLAMVIGGKVVSAPVIRSAIKGGRALITGRFTREEAQDIANKLNAYRDRCQKHLNEIRKEIGRKKK